MRIVNHTFGGMVAWLALGAAACGGSDAICVGEDGSLAACESATEGDDAAPLTERLAAIDAELAVGAQGSDVRAVHEYLTEYGYLPNEDLQSRFPSWQPFVDELPADPEMYDDVTYRAVRRLQLNSGLAATGVLDEPTRQLLASERCPLPDGVLGTSAAEVDKFKHTTQLLSDVDLTWQVVNVNGTSFANFRSFWCTSAGSCAQGDRFDAVVGAFHQAFETWERQTGVRFTQAAGGAAGEIQITFTTDASFAMKAAFPNEPRPYPIQVSSAKNWFVGREVASPAAGWNDIETTALHEIGHLLGLSHSTVTGQASTPGADIYGATMTPGVRDQLVDWVLHPDDDVAGSTKYQDWIGMPLADASGVSLGAISDIAAGNTQVWVVSGRAYSGGGSTIHSIPISTALSGSATWSNHVAGGQGARRIAMGQANVPWIINASGQVMERVGNGWTLRGTPSNCAYDIGVGGTSGTGSVWILGCTEDASGGHKVYRWNGATATWEQPNANARGWRITVDHAGIPWLIDAFGEIWRRPPAVGDWTKLPGTAIDIGGGPAATAANGTLVISNVYVTRPDHSIWAWTEQPEDPSPGTDLVTGAFVRSQLGEAIGVAVAANGSPWVRAANGTVWAQR